MRGFDLHAAGVAEQVSPAAGRTTRLPPVQQRFLALQRFAGNRAIAQAMPTAQRCGPVPCDCPPEERAEKERGPASARSVRRTVGDLGPTAAVQALEWEHLPGHHRITTHGRRRQQAPGLDPPPLAPGPWITLITIDLSAQHLTAQLSDNTTRGIQVSTGKGLCGIAGNPCAHAGNNNDECTPPGTHFRVQSRHGRDYHGVDGAHHNTPDHHMAYYVGFVDARGIGIHNSQIADGTPRSHGCVRVGTDLSPGGFAFWLNTHVRVGQTAIHVTGVAAARSHPCPTPPDHRHHRQPQHRRRA